MVNIDALRDIVNGLTKKEHSNRYWLKHNRKYAYGAAGIRGRATEPRRHENSEMTFIAYRMGYLAGLLARSKNTVVGVMISGGHNSKDDNGIKIIDSDGSILDPEWMRRAFNLLNADDDEFLISVCDFEKHMQREKPPIVIAKVLCAHDSRASSDQLVEAVKLGTKLTTADWEYPFELLRDARGASLPTPILHFVLFTRDPDRRTAARMGGSNGDVLSGYYDHFRSVFHELNMLLTARPIQGSDIKYQSKLHLDCANGVGSIGMIEFMKDIDPNHLDIDFRNDTAGEAVNDQCGADFVMNFPHNAPSDFNHVDVKAKCAALSGDGARLVYFYRKEDGTVEFLDGDKIALLIAKFITEHINLLGLMVKIKKASEEFKEATEKFKTTLVQSSFTNEGARSYAGPDSDIRRKFADDGLRYSSQWESKERHCVIYFQSCGLGRASFSKHFFEKLEFCSKHHPNRDAAERLLKVCCLFNASSFDGMTNLLLVETILRYYNWTVQDWAKEFEYLPSKQIKIDKILVASVCKKKSLIDAAVFELCRIRNMNEYMKVRVSSTENNLVRVYVESQTTDKLEDLAKKIETAIKKVVGRCKTVQDVNALVRKIEEGSNGCTLM